MSNENKKPDSKPVRAAESFIKSAIDFEKSKIDEIKLSRKIAWLIAGGASALTLFAFAMLLIVVFRHQEVKPQILQVEKGTGQVTLLQSLDENSKVTYTETVDKYWLGQYVKYRESYDWWTLSQTYDTVQLMTLDKIFPIYDAEVRSPESLLNTCKEDCKTEVKIEGVTFLNDVAQVRFTKQKLSVNGVNTDLSPKKNYTAVIAYKYDTERLLTDQQRLLNPTAFTVLSYRKDEEVTK